MRRQIFGLILALAAGAALAQPLNENPPTRTIQCIDVGGRLVPSACQATASRLDPREDICTCPRGGERIDVAICAKGQHEPPEGRALFAARSRAIRDGSLIGDKVGDRPICVAPRGRR